MGRAIKMENDVETNKRDIKQLQSAFDGLSSVVEELKQTIEDLTQNTTVRKNIDIHKEVKKGKKRIVEEAEV